MEPVFVRDVMNLKLTPKEVQKESWLGNWTYLQIHLKNNEKILNERDYMVLMHLELKGKKRMSIIYRLKTRFNAVRHQRELMELNACKL